MSESCGFLSIFAVGAFIGWLIWRSTRAHAYGTKTVDRNEDQILTEVEQWMLGHFSEFPNASDEEIAQLTRDDLQNHRIKDPRAYKWATAETAGRIRRNIFRTVRAQVLAEQAERERPPVPNEERRACSSCGCTSPADADRCTNCMQDFEEGKPKAKTKKSKVKTNEEEEAEESAALVVRLKRCRHCKRKVRGDRKRCPECQGWL